ncbi:MAG: hypothetical protein AB1530_00540 [Candidatus Omnitrophota bacterium]
MNPNIFACYRNIIEKIARENNIYQKKDFPRITKILFDGCHKIRPNSFKFDFSFKIKKMPNRLLRFSINDSGEKKEFLNKIRSIMRLSYAGELRRQAEKAIQVIKSFPITLGLEWIESDQSPILKIEVECVPFLKHDILHKLCIISGYDPDILGLYVRYGICALALVCSPKSNQMSMKLYFKYCSLQELNKFSFLPHGIKTKFSAFFKNSPKNNVFYLAAVKFKKSGKVDSLKNYLIYETGEFQCNSNLEKRWIDIKKLKVPLSSVNKFIYRANNFSGAYNCCIYPTALGLSLLNASRPKEISMYCSILPCKYGSNQTN